MKYKAKFIRVIAIACCSVFLLSSTGCRGKAAQSFGKAALSFLRFLKKDRILDNIPDDCIQDITEYYIKKDKNYIHFPQ